MDVKDAPNWKPDSKEKTKDVKMKTLSLDETSAKDAYRFMTSMIVPRPIAWVSTLNKKGQSNLAPFSFFNGVGSNPPALMFSIVPKRNGEQKDTLKNILETKEFVVNGVNEDLLAVMHHSSAEYEHSESEIESLGLQTIASNKISAPRIQAAPWHFECKLYGTMLVGNGGPGSGTIVIGEILCMHFDEDLIVDRNLDTALLKPMARAGGRNYIYGGEHIAMPNAEKVSTLSNT